MDNQQRRKALQSIMWDYKISSVDLEKLLDGKIPRAGHYTRESLFIKMIEGLPWFTIIQILPVSDVKEMLTNEVIEALWPKSLQTTYKYVSKRLQEVIPAAG